MCSVWYRVFPKSLVLLPALDLSLVMIGSAAARVLYLPLAPRQVIPGRSSPPSRATQLYIPCRGAGWSSCRYIKSRALPVRAATAGPDGRDGGQVNGEGVLALGGDGRLNVDGVKSSLYQAVQGINRGIFGATSAKKAEIEGLVEQLESLNPIPNPTDQLSKLDGCWKLIYSTISILGSKRTKLGLRDFITLDDFLQTINSAQRKAINEIKFNARGFKMLSGQLTIVASFSVASKTRVDIKFESSEIAPDQLMSLFQKNYDMLLNIFNPDGWLEITYVDESFRIGRDDKGNVFILQRFKLDEI